MPAKRSGQKTAARRNPSDQRWSAAVTQHSHAMDLEKDVFKLPRAVDIAQSLKASAEASHNRKSTPFRSAMSMLNFYSNRAGKNLSPERRAVIDEAKQELRKLFGRT